MVQADSREICVLQCQVKALQGKTAKMGNQLCHNNVQVVDIPKWVEGSKPAKCVEQFLSTLLGLHDLPPKLVVEQAHRVPLHY